MVHATQFYGSLSGEILEKTAELPPIKQGEVLVRVTHSGLCGSDVHQLTKPLVLGHEGVGIIEEVFPGSTRFQVGDRVGWGPVSSTCSHCDPCMSGKDAYCLTARMYGMHDFDSLGSVCSYTVRTEQWIFKIPDAITSEDAAPLMCKSHTLSRGGGTVWVPLVEQCKPYERVAIVGIGGLGHLAIQFAAKMGCDVVVFSGSEDKRKESMELGASEFYVTRGVDDYTTLGLPKPVDRVVITSSAKYNLGVFYPIMARNATILPLSVDGGDLVTPYMATVFNGHKIVGSCVTSRYDQNKMLDFASRHHIYSIVEKYPMTLAGVKEAMKKLADGKMRYRAVLSWA